MYLLFLFQAAELLGHPHLQPYVIRIQLKLNSPRRSTFPLQWSDQNFIKKTRFLEPETGYIQSDREKRWLFSNDRALNPSVSETEQESLSSTQRARDYHLNLNQKFKELSFGIVHEEIGTEKSALAKFSNASRTPRFVKACATPRRQMPSKTSHVGLKRDSVSLSKLSPIQSH